MAKDNEKGSGYLHGKDLNKLSKQEGSKSQDDAISFITASDKSSTQVPVSTLPKRSLFSFTTNKKSQPSKDAHQIKRVSSVNCAGNRNRPTVHPRVANTVKKGSSMYVNDFYEPVANTIYSNNSNPNLSFDTNKSSFRRAISKFNIFRHGNSQNGNNNSNINLNNENDVKDSSLQHKHSLRYMNVYYEIGRLMEEFSKKINCENDIRGLCIKILRNAAITLNIDRCSLFLVEKDLPQRDSKVLVEFIFDITNKSSAKSNLTSIDELVSPTKNKSVGSHTICNVSSKANLKTCATQSVDLESAKPKNFSNRQATENKHLCCNSNNCDELKDHSNTVDMISSTHHYRCIVIPWGVGIAGKSAQTGNVINIEDAYNESYFYEKIDCITGYRTKSVLCIPLKNSTGEVVGVVEAINKLQDGNNNRNGSCGFTLEDEEAFTVYAELCSLALDIREKILSLNIHQNKSKIEQLFHQLNQQSDLSLELLFSEVLNCLMELINCQQISIILTNDDDQLSFKHIFTLEKNNKQFIKSFNNNKRRLNSSVSRVPIEYAIESVLCRKIINWFIEMSSETSSTTVSNICSCPINDAEDEIWGILQCVNRQNAPYFNYSDVELLKATTTYLSLLATTLSTREENLKIHARNKILIEIFSYHVQPSNRLVLKLLSRILPSGESLGIYRFEFDDTIFDDDTTVLIGMRFFIDLNLNKTFRIENRVLCRWLYTLKNNYRQVKYHNWRHAVNVTHAMFFLLKMTSLGRHFSDIQKLALLVACISHDVDHRGYNNGFYSKINSPLTHLYSTSTLECHHFDQCMLVLNMRGCNILKHLNVPDFSNTIEYIEQSIMDTDLSNYIKNRGQFFKSIKEGVWSSGSAVPPKPQHIRLLKSMMMTISDLNSSVKSWSVHYRTSALISEEFFMQGDVEMKLLKQCPLTLLDRKQSTNLPNMQIDFIDAMVFPLVQNLITIEPDLNFMETNMIENKSNWDLLIGKFDYNKFKKDNNLDVLYIS